MATSGTKLSGGTTVTGNYLSGGSGLKAMAFIVYKIAETATQVKITIQTGYKVQTTKINSGVNMSVTGKVAVHLWDNKTHLDPEIGSFGTKTYSNSVTNTYTYYGSKTDRVWTYNKGTSAYNVTISEQVYTPISPPTVSKTFSIPALAKYTVTYNSNGGTGVSSGSYYYGNQYQITSTVPTKAGYTFQNKWNTNSSGIGTNYTSGVKYSLGNKSLTLYAVWKENTGTITYNANSTGESTDIIKNLPSPGTKYYTKTYTIPTTKPTRTYNTEDWAFMEWNTAADGSGTTYQPGQVLPANNSNSLTLYAIWKKTFNISFYKPDGEYAAEDSYPEVTTWDYNKPLTFLTNNPIINYTKVSDENAYYSHYKLDYWYDVTRNIERITSDMLMPAMDLYIRPIWEESSLLNINSNSIVRASVEDNTYKQNDTGESGLIKMNINIPNVYKYSYSTENNKKIYSYEGENYIPSTFTVKAVPTGEDPDSSANVKQMTFTSSKQEIEQGWITDNSNNETDIFDLDTKYDIYINGEATITDNEDHSIDLKGTQAAVTDFLSRAVFTIDFSANGDRIGIFQPIEDLSDSDATEIQENEVELSGNFVVKDQNRTIVLNRDGSIVLKNWFIQQDSNETISFFYMGTQEEES